MKCRNRFKVVGLLRLNEIRPIRCRGYIWEFEQDRGVISHICVTVAVTQRQYWPTVTPNPAPGIACTISVIPVHTAFIQMELRTLQGLLSLFGVRSIDISNPEVEWIPESDEERSYLKVSGFKSTLQESSPGSIPPMSFDIAACAVLACHKAYEIEMPLSFFRRAVVDMHEQEFIQAIYDLYFVLETVYGAGKFKKADVLANFQGADELRQAVEQVLRGSDRDVTWENDIRNAFVDKFSRMTVDQYLEHVVDLRGFLHHHTQKRSGIWHPEDQNRYKVDAVVLESVVFNALFHMAWPYLDDPEVVSQYKAQFGTAI